MKFMPSMFINNNETSPDAAATIPPADPPTATDVATTPPIAATLPAKKPPYRRNVKWLRKMKPCDPQYLPLYYADSPALLKELDNRSLPACLNCGSPETHIFEVEPPNSEFTQYGHRRLVCLACKHELRICGIVPHEHTTGKGRGGSWKPVCMATPADAETFRCKRHDRKWLTIFNSPDYDGGYGQLLPERLQAAYEAIANDPNLVNSRHELTLLKTFLMDKVNELEAVGGSAGGWEDLRELWGQMELASKAGDAEKSKALFIRIGRLIKDGSRREEITAEIRQMAKEKVAMARVEQDTLESQQRVCTQEQVLTLVAALAKAVREVVVDDEQLKIIDARFQKILGNGGDDAVVV
jgi:hypothetical protein